MSISDVVNDSCNYPSIECVCNFKEGLVQNVLIFRNSTHPLSTKPVPLVDCNLRSETIKQVFLSSLSRSALCLAK